MAALVAALLLHGCGGSASEPDDDAGQAPLILDESSRQPATAGGSATFSVDVEGPGTFQWQVQDDGDWHDIVGERGPNMTLQRVGVESDGRRYRVLVRGQADTVSSGTFVLSVGPRRGRPLDADTPELGDLADLNLVIGETAQFTITATNIARICWFAKRQGGSWTQVQCGPGNTLELGPARLADSGTKYQARAVGSNGLNLPASNAAELKVSQLLIRPVRAFRKLDVYPYATLGEGDGGTNGGGDGDGAGGGGGLGKALNARIKIIRLKDGKVLGSALTDSESGLVRIKAAPGTTPVLMTLQGTHAQGTKASVYFDEGRNKRVPIGPDVTLHALLSHFNENVGVTPLSEAAYRYAINNFLLDPAEVASGAEPLRKTVSIAKLMHLKKARVEEANEVVRTEINRRLPAKARLASVTALPTPIDSASSTSALNAGPYGISALVTGGLVADAGGFNGSLSAPALKLADQLANDLTDGKLDGFGLDRKPAAAVRDMAYHAARLPASVMVGGDAVASRFGRGALVEALPLVAEAVISRRIGAIGDCAKTGYHFDESFLRRDGTVVRFQTEYDNPLSCGDVTSATRYDHDVAGVRQVVSGSAATFFVGVDGSVRAAGSNVYGLLGKADVGFSQSRLVSIAGLKGVSSVAAATCTALARTGAGQVYSWGRDCAGSLGRSVADDACSDDGICPVPRPVQMPASVEIADIYATSSETLVGAAKDLETSTLFALDADGKVYAWGSGKYGLRGDGQRGDDALPSNRPKLIAGLRGVRSIAATRTLAFALLRDGTVKAWGTNANGEFASGDHDERLSPQRVTALDDLDIEQLAVGRNGIFARLTNGDVWRWGRLRPTDADSKVRTTPERDLALHKLGKVRHISGAGYFIMADGRIFKFEKDGKTLFDAADSFDLGP